ncbi:hypothetical protein NC796_03965 [Aliifodinibius sp. S!AR15-10]|uniref:hypothetical protein n=1 Tax=Aliifodinibius sp. S!AR15-10 TaxID=2950437 RepID=UPI00285DC865|nr:hypothetical protein [Aliifodinibius sp. S!AR15-10]MDR8390283.1 hypothetical protein [Aliifodinibius sp. S!AR15-10]
MTGKDAEIDYLMFGRLTGLHTSKGDDIDHFLEDDNGNKDYKTNSFTKLKNEHTGSRKKLEALLAEGIIKQRVFANFKKTFAF